MFSLLDALNSLLGYVTENKSVAMPLLWKQLPEELRETLNKASIQLGEYLASVEAD